MRLILPIVAAALGLTSAIGMVAGLALAFAATAHRKPRVPWMPRRPYLQSPLNILGRPEELAEPGVKLRRVALITLVFALTCACVSMLAALPVILRK